MAVNLPEEFHIGYPVVSYRNGKISNQKISNLATRKSNGLKLTTDSGNCILVTKDQNLWASLPEYETSGRDGYNSVYLMYREGFGFRVGVTNKGYSKDSENNLSSRLVQEGGDKLWILDCFLTRGEALLKEEIYSLKYSIPTAVFNGKKRGLDQDYINNIFKIFGSNGSKILEEKSLSFHLPHWQNSSSNRGSIKRNVINFVNHSLKGSQVSLEWSMDNNISDLLTDKGITFTKAKGEDRSRIRKFFLKNSEANLFFKRIKSILNLDAIITLSNEHSKCLLLNAASIYPGMSVPVLQNGKLILQKIVNIEEGNDLTLSDIEVEDAGNLFVGNILVPTI